MLKKKKKNSTKPELRTHYTPSSENNDYRRRGSRGPKPRVHYSAVPFDIPVSISSFRVIAAN